MKKALTLHVDLGKTNEILLKQASEPKRLELIIMEYTAYNLGPVWFANGKASVVRTLFQIITCTKNRVEHG